jgi:hypothetical protein
MLYVVENEVVSWQRKNLKRGSMVGMHGEVFSNGNRMAPLLAPTDQNIAGLF